MMTKMVAAVVALALGVSPVQAGCWSAQEASAGTIRDLQTMLMVATLRCQAAHTDITADYNLFLGANKTTIQTLNERLKTHFIKAAGPAGGQRAYDSFVTTLANAYGAQASTAEICGATAALEREAALMAGDEEGLLLLAQRQGIATALPEGVCALATSNVALNTVAAPSLMNAAPAAALTTMASVRSGPSE